MSTEGGELERTLGFLEAMTLGGGTMIGAGIFILPGLAAQSAGPASALSYAIAGFVALLAALSLSELATGMPIAGGSYHYVNRALGGLFGTIVGWGMWTGLMFASAFYMVGFGQYLVESLPFLDGRVLVVGLGLVGLLALVAMNYYGTEESSSFQNVTIGVEVVIVVVFVAVGVLSIDPANLEPFAPTGASGVVATTGLVFISFLGFEIIATVAGEIEDPGRTIPRSMLLSVVLVTGLYVLVMLVSTGVLPIDRLAASPIPVADVAAVYLGPVGAAAIVFAAVVAAISSSNSSILAASRVIYAMGRDGVVTGWLNASHRRYFTPHRAIVTTGAVTALLVGAGLRVDAIVALLAEAASFSFLVTYSLVHVAVIVFRRADPDEYDPTFRLPHPLYPAVPVLGVALSLVVVSQMAPVVVLVGSGIVAFGTLWYAVYARPRVVSEGLLREALRPSPVDPYRVVVPVSNPTTQGGLLRLAAASAHANAAGGRPELVAVNVTRVEHPSPLRNVEADRADHRQELLASAHDVADEAGVHLRTRTVVAGDVAAALLAAIAKAEADAVVLGWDGTLGAGGHTFGSLLDPVVAGTACPVSLACLHGEDVGRVAALVAPDPDAPVVARRAVEFASAAGDGRVPTLFLVGSEGDGDDALAVEPAGTVGDVAAAAGLAPGEYERGVVLDGPDAMGDALRGYDTVCVGLPATDGDARPAVGSLTERVVRAAPGSVVLVRGPTS